MRNIPAIILFLVYSVFMIYLSLKGNKKTNSINSFTKGDGDMGVWVVGLSLASSFTSAATLLSMPGYVYQAGLSGIVYFNIFQTLGLFIGLLVIGKKIRNSDMIDKVISIPEWLRTFYNSKGLGYFFAAQSIFTITFMVLIVVLMTSLISSVFNVNYNVATILITIYVFGYSIVGGSYTHGWSGLLQSLVMIIIVVWLFYVNIPSQLEWLMFKENVIIKDPYYFSVFNPNGIIFNDAYEVIYCAFLMGFCNVFQPHIFNKALYLQRDKSWNKATIIGILAISIFNLILLVGLFIRVKQPNLTNYDTLLINYISSTMSTIAIALIFITTIAAAMSTLNGVIIGLSSNLYSELIPKSIGEKKSLLYVRVIVAIIGVITIIFALNPPSFILIRGMWGYNILMSASLVPMACTLWFPNVNVKSVTASAIVNIAVFIILMTSGITINGARACGLSIPAAVLTTILCEVIIKNRKKNISC